MTDNFKGALSPETEKVLGDKLKFKNFVLEAGDDYVIRLIDNHVLSPLMDKLPDDIRPVVRDALKEVINDMPVITI